MPGLLGESSDRLILEGGKWDIDEASRYAPARSIAARRASRAPAAAARAG